MLPRPPLGKPGGIMHDPESLGGPVPPPKPPGAFRPRFGRSMGVAQGTRWVPGAGTPAPGSGTTPPPKRMLIKERPMASAKQPPSPGARRVSAPAVVPISKRLRDKTATVHVGGKAKYPIPDAGHARAALARINQAKPPLTAAQKATVRAKANSMLRRGK